MNQLAFFVSEKHLYEGTPLYEWLLEDARELGVLGGSAFRAIAGFGRHGRLHEETFFELAGELTVKVEFILDDKLTEQVLQRVRSIKQSVFYTCHEVQAGIL